MSSLKLIWQPFYDTLLKCQWISVRGLLLINAEIIAGYRNVGKIWVASAAAEHSFQFLWQKNFFSLHLHLGVGANIAAMESRSQDSFTPSYKFEHSANSQTCPSPFTSRCRCKHCYGRTGPRESYKYPNAADAKFQSAIYIAQIVFLSWDAEYCGHLLDASADPLTSKASLCTKFCYFGPNCDPESLKTLSFSYLECSILFDIH